MTLRKTAPQVPEAARVSSVPGVVTRARGRAPVTNCDESFRQITVINMLVATKGKPHYTSHNNIVVFFGERG